jgi:hypothetical protein
MQGGVTVGVTVGVCVVELQCGLVFKEAVFSSLFAAEVVAVPGEAGALDEDSLEALSDECFFSGGALSNSTSSTFALLRLTTTTDSPSRIATDNGDLPDKKSSI